MRLRPPALCGKGWFAFPFCRVIILADNGRDNVHDHAIGWAILAVILIMVLTLFWYFHEYNVKEVVRWLRYGQIWVISWFVGDDYGVPWGRNDIKLDAMLRYLPKVPKMGLNDTVMAQISTVAMYPLRFILTGLLLLMAFWALFNGPKTQYRTKLDINGLIKRQARNFPYISPFIAFNPANQPPRPPGAPVPAELPAFGEALGPEEWLAYNDVPVPDGKVDGDAAARAFSRQLGPPWRGAMHMAPYRQVLLAAFCLKSLRKRSDADEMLGRLAQCWSFEKGLVIPPALLKDARKVLRSRDMAGKILSKCNQHAYENTAMIRAISTAREEGGVMAPAQFVWLRAYDRAMWYPLNNIGRQAYHMEALGAMCHYKAEKQTARPIPRPKMEDAVTAITEHMLSDKARPIPPLDYSRSKKRGIKKVKGT